MSCPLAVFVPEFGARSETFIRRHVQELLPGRTLAIGGRLNGGALRDWDANGPLLDLGAIADLKTVARWLRDYGVQVMLAEYLDASLPWLDLARNVGIRFFVHAHGYDVSLRLREPVYRREYLRYQDADGIITMSQVSRVRLLDLGLPPTKIHVIPYGVDVARNYVERRPSNQVCTIAVGRMVPKKAPILLLDAFRRAAALCSSLHLDYIGAGALLPAAVQYVKALEMDRAVTLHGGQPHGFVQLQMGKADIFVQHSITDPEFGDEEGLPVAILEAMGCGLPVVATRHAGIPEAVEDGITGFLVEEGDIHGMADRILRLSKDPELRVAMGKAGRERAWRKYSWSRERAELLQLLGLENLDSL